MGKLLINGRVSIVGMFVLVCLALPGAGRADPSDEGWGDLGYSKSEAEVEAIPTAIDSDGSDAYHAVEPSPQAMAANSDSINTSSSSATLDSTVQSEDIVIDNEALARAQTETEAADRAKNKGKSSANASAGSSSNGRAFGRISTVRNTHGVLTEEDPGVQFYVAPFGGMTAITGNTTVDASSRYAFGAQAGLLLTSNLLLGVTYTFSEQSLSGPRTSQTSGNLAPMNDVFALKSNTIEAGGKLFFLGRESRVRPFFGGGFGWAKSYLNYTTANLQAMGYSPSYLTDFAINQFGAFGELGAEVAITRAIVATANFKLRGVLSTSTSADNSTEAASIDPTKATVGNSLSRSASYSIGAGLGIYF